MTDLLDIYEAMGGVRNEDGTVTLSMPPEPFKIELTVAMRGLEVNYEGTDRVMLGVLGGEILSENGGRIEAVDVEIELPVDVIRLAHHG